MTVVEADLLDQVAIPCVVGERRVDLLARDVIGGRHRVGVAVFSLVGADDGPHRHTMFDEAVVVTARIGRMGTDVLGDQPRDW